MDLQRTSYDEGGEMIVAVPNKEAFQGYWRSQASTDRKFCTDVFKKGGYILQIWRRAAARA